VLDWKSLAIVAAVFLSWVIWNEWSDISDWTATDDEMQHRVAISVGSPTIHTRERLLNDRFEQVSWLDRELEVTNPIKATAPEPVASAAPNSEATKPAAAETRPNGAFSVASEFDVGMRYGWNDPQQAFDVMNGFRDVLRAERARAMLDDRHDMDDNTLDLFSFDTTVMPRESARGYAAIEALITRTPDDLIGGGKAHQEEIDRLNDQKHKDLFDTYVGWLEKVRDLQQSNLITLAQTLDEQEMFEVRPDYESVLRIAACSELLRVALSSGLPDEDRAACRAAAAGSTPRDLRQVMEASPNAAALWAMKMIDDVVLAARRESLTSRVRIFLDTLPRPYLEKWHSAVVSQQHNADPDVRLYEQNQNEAAIFVNPDEIVAECMSPTAPPAVNVVSAWLVNAMARELANKELPYLTFPCAETKNAAWRLLFALIDKLVKPDGLRRDVLPQSGSPAPPGKTRLPEWTVPILPGIELSNLDIEAAPTSCLAAMLLEENAVRPTAEQPRNHGASLTEFFDIRVDRLSTGCTMAVEPRVLSLRPSGEHRPGDLKLLDDLDRLLEGPSYSDAPDPSTTRAYSYSLSPRLRQNVEIKGSQKKGASLDINGNTADFSRARGLDFRGVDPEVVGFSRPTKSSSSLRGARFGWLISPRPGKELTWSVPLEQAQLGAVVALPSWWRSALLQICVRFVPQNSIADVMDDRFWNHPNQCRVEVIRLPGSSADVSRRLGMDVLTTPYMENWKRPPVVYAGLTGEPTHLLITGERLWRNTVVTLGGQKADQIEVLPDMVGIAATFRCIRRPTTVLIARQPWMQASADGNVDASRPAGTPGSGTSASKQSVTSDASNRMRVGAPEGTGVKDSTSGGGASAPVDLYSMPVIVWTSEGHTSPQFATVIVQPSNPTPPCPSPATEAATRTGALQQSPKETTLIGNSEAGRQVPTSTAK
jgi:hypothetical protein